MCKEEHRPVLRGLAGELLGIVERDLVPQAVDADLHEVPVERVHSAARMVEDLGARAMDQGHELAEAWLVDFAEDLRRHQEAGLCAPVVGEHDHVGADGQQVLDLAPVVFRQPVKEGQQRRLTVREVHEDFLERPEGVKFLEQADPAVEDKVVAPLGLHPLPVLQELLAADGRNRRKLQRRVPSLYRIPMREPRHAEDAVVPDRAPLVGPDLVVLAARIHRAGRRQRNSLEGHGIVGRVRSKEVQEFPAMNVQAGRRRVVEDGQAVRPCELEGGDHALARIHGRFLGRRLP